jgi:hypothetical protein
MRCRTAALACLGLAVAAPAGSGSAPRAEQCGGVEYPAPSKPHVEVSPAEVIAGQPARLQFVGGDEANVVPGSGRFEVSGPAGTATRKADEHGAASFTPPAPGHYTAVASWKEYHCADGPYTTYWDITTPEAAFEAKRGKRPTVAFRTSRRPRRANSPGDATLTGFLRCPAPSQASSDPTELVVYYERGGGRPTHDSPHLRLTVPGGCDGNHDAGNPHRRGKGFYLNVNRDQVAATATAPTRLRVLIEIRYAGQLLGRAYATFAPSATGESVRRG